MFRTFTSRLVNTSLLKSKKIAESLVSKNYSDGRPLIEKSINEVTLLGRCGTDPIQRGSDVKPVVMLSLATNSHYKTKESGDSLVQKTEWHRITVFKPRLLERTLNYAKKGSRILVKGKLSYGEVTDKNGVKHQTTTVIAEDIIFLWTKGLENEIPDDSDVEIEA